MKSDIFDLTFEEDDDDFMEKPDEKWVPNVAVSEQSVRTRPKRNRKKVFVISHFLEKYFPIQDVLQIDSFISGEKFDLSTLYPAVSSHQTES